MRVIKYILLCAFLSLVASGLAAKDRVVEKSGKTPDWLMTSDENGFSVFAKSDDINVARDRCLDDIRQYIVNTIASNITSVETNTMDLQNRDGLETLYTTYNSELKTAAAKLPFLTGITLSNALEVYWEKCKSREDGSFYYNYHVLYPFTVAQRNRMIKEFKEYDAEKYGLLMRLKEGYSALSDVSEIDAGIRELEPLVEYFFDDVRKQEAESLMASYRKAYSLISIVPVSQELGRFVYTLVLDGHDITCSKSPQLRSETASSIVLKPVGREYEITYDYTYCYPTDDNYIQINYSFPGASLKYRHQIDISQKEKLVSPYGFIDLDCVKADSTDMKVTVSMTLRSRTDKEFSAGAVSFSLPEAGLEIDTDEMTVFKGKGTQLYNITFPLSEMPAENMRGMVKGTMQIVYNDGRKDTAAFTLPYNLKVYGN